MEVKGKVEELSVEEFVRWACLIEAVEIASEKCADLGMNPDTDDIWIKPTAYNHYINERYPSMLHGIQKELSSHR